MHHTTKYYLTIATYVFRVAEAKLVQAEEQAVLGQPGLNSEGAVSAVEPVQSQAVSEQAKLVKAASEQAALELAVSGEIVQAKVEQVMPFSKPWVASCACNERGSCWRPVPASSEASLWVLLPR